MKPPVRKPRGQSSLCDLPPPSHLGSVGTVSYKFCRKRSSPWWGLWAPGREPLPAATSLFPVMSWCHWSFWDPHLGKDSRTFPAGSKGNCSPSSETLLNPTAQGIMISTSPRELPADREATHTPFMLGVCSCFPSGLLLLTCHINWILSCPLFHHQTHDDTKKNPDWPPLWVTGSKVDDSPFSWKLTAKIPPEIFVPVFLFHLASCHLSFSPLVQLSRHFLTWLNKAELIK